MVFLAFNSKPKHARPLRTWVITVALVSTIAALCIAAFAGWYSWQQQKLQLDQNLVATTRALTQLAERELDRASTIGQAAATSALLQSGDLHGFDRQARMLIRPSGYFLILSEVGSARELINTDIPLGVTPSGLPPEWVGSVGAGPTVKPLVLRDTDRYWTAGVQLLASTNAGPLYVITIGIPAARFQAIIDEQRLPPQWLPVILDQDWTIVARGTTSEKFVGKKGANPQLKDLPTPDSMYEGQVLEAYETVNARSRSDQTGWTAAIAVPKSFLFTQFLTPTLLAATAGFFVSLFALAAIGMFANRVVRDVQALSKATEQLSNGQVATTAAMHIEELQNVVGAMQDASKRIEAEQQFRKRTVDELAHRLRNKVATIQAILLFQLSAHPQLRDEVCARLHALAATDELIIAAQGRGASLREIIVTEMRAYDLSRVAAHGPDVVLEPKLALTMALLFHELATNAAKYGALSGAKGLVSIRWSIRNDVLSVQWHETGGPTVSQPLRRGFGTKLVTGALATFGGKAKARFEPTGLIVDMTVVIPQPPPPAIVPNTELATQESPKLAVS